MASYKIIKSGWVHPMGSIITDDDLPEGRSIDELIKMGIAAPSDGQHPVPMDPKDAKGWKARSDAFEKENQELRTATVDGTTLARVKDLESENEALKGRVAGLEHDKAQLIGSVVPLDQFRDVNAELQSLRKEHEELQANYGKLSAEKASKPEKDPTP